MVRCIRFTRLLRVVRCRLLLLGLWMCCLSVVAVVVVASTLVRLPLVAEAALVACFQSQATILEQAARPSQLAQGLPD